MSDRSKFAETTKQWQKHHLEAEYSTENATHVFLTPFNLSHRLRDSPSEGLDALAKEASDLANAAAMKNVKSALFQQATYDDFMDTIRSTEVSDVTIIGHGNIASVLIEPANGGPDRIDWHDIGMNTTHLKTGLFIQRLCSGRPRSLNVPLGLFSVSDARNIYISASASFDSNNMISATKTSILSYGEVKSQFPQSDVSLHYRFKMGLVSLRNTIQK